MTTAPTADTRVLAQSKPDGGWMSSDGLQTRLAPVHNLTQVSGGVHSHTDFNVRYWA